jgi:hypothetical protein
MFAKISLSMVSGRRSPFSGHAGVSCVRLLIAGVAAAVVVCVVGAVPAWAAVGWSVRSVAAPSVFSERGGNEYQVLVLNTGDSASSGTVTVTDTLPRGMVGEAYTEGQGRGVEWSCTPGAVAVVTCTVSTSIPAGGYAPVLVVRVTSPGFASGVVTNEVTVEGGGAGVAASTREETQVSPLPQTFGLSEFDVEALDANGLTQTGAGAHPNAVIANIDFPAVLPPPGITGKLPVEEVKDVVVELPAGFLGDPLATPRCPLSDGGAAQEAEPGKETGEFEEVCRSLESEVGAVAFRGGTPFENFYTSTARERGRPPLATSVYNMVPEAGYPAEFQFAFGGSLVDLYGGVVHNSSGYRLRVDVPGVPAVIKEMDAQLAFFGNAVDHNGGVGDQAAFLTNPTDCSAGPLTTRIEVDSWEHPERWVSKETTTYPQIEECNLLQFTPSLQFAPSPVAEGGASQAGVPSAYDVDLKVPQTSLFEETATPALRSATVALPVGVSISPSSANGLAGCQASGPEGIDIGDSTGLHPDEVGEGEMIGPDGLSHLVAGHCPVASTLASVEVLTPLLSAPLEGHLFLAAPKCGGQGQPACTAASATNGELYGVYLEAAGSGVVVKQPGTIRVDPVSGQVTTTFSELPQFPFGELRIHFHGGPRAALMTPAGCGTYTTTSQLTPWGGSTVESTSAFSIQAGCGAEGFAPAFTAGTVGNQAGAFSPLSVTVSRQDGEQDLGGVSVTTPPGLLGILKGVERCGEPQAGLGTCGAGSLIGHTTVTAGPGSDPVMATGQVFLTDGYGGGAFGLSIVVPAVAGPFNLGNVIVRAAIHVDPHTAQVTVVSDPLPRILEGVPLHVRTVNVSIDRPGFIFNPTDCEPLSVGGTLTSAQGTSAQVSSPFHAANCASLGFHPVFTVSTQAKTSKQGGASLVVKTSYPASAQANIHSVAVSLPKQLPSRLTTIQQACPEAVFAANPASCPAGSDVGMATATTPVLASQVTGPAYLVSHGGAAFPDLVVILQGEGVTVELVGSIDIKKGVTSSTFANLPDAPIGSFALTFPEGPHSALTTNLPAKAKGSLCGQNLVMPTTITAQNGAVIKQSTKIAVTGCPKAKPKPKAKKHKQRVKGKKKR